MRLATKKHKKHKGVFVFLVLLCGYSLFASCSTASPDKGAAPPEPQPLGRIDFPTYEKRVLSNGLTVYALESHEQPVVAVRLVIKAGAVHDPNNLSGVAAFTADLLNKGTKTRSATQIAEAIDQVGGSLEAGADMESTTISASVLTDSVGLAFALMNDIVMNPAFAQDELARTQQQTLSGLAANLEDPEFIADVAFERVVYGLHPYGHLENGTLSSIPKIRRDDLVRFHQTYFAPNVSALAIAGDLSTSEAFGLAEQWFGSWQKKEVPAIRGSDVPRLEGRRIVVIDKPDSVQTEIRVGQTTVPRKDPDYFNTLVSSYVLGGSASSRLNQTLRAERGLTYGAYTSVGPKIGPGTFFSTTDTRTEKTAEALSLVFEQLQRLASSAVPDQELGDAKSYLIGSFPLSIEVPSDLAGRLTGVFLYDLGDDYLKTYRDRLADVSASDVLRVTKEKLSSNNVAVVLVGRADGFREQLTGLGKVEVIPISRLDLDSPNLTKNQ
jgi:zinc protease